MSSQDISLTVEERSVLGKQVKQLRKDGLVPAVIHNHGADSKIVMAPFIELSKVYASAGKHHPVTLQLGNEKYMTLIKEADFEPTKHTLRHVVFNAIRQDEKAETEVPIILEGEIPAEKISLLVLTHIDSVKLEGLPKDLVDSLKVDASSLADVGDKLTVADIKVPAGLTILTEPEAVIASVEMPKDQIAEADAAAAEQAELDGKTEEATEPAEGEAAEGAEASKEETAKE